MSNQFFNDMSRFAQGAAGNMLELKRELEQQMTTRMEALLQKFDYPTREEFNALKEMVVKLREEQEGSAEKPVDKPVNKAGKKPADKLGDKAAK